MFTNRASVFIRFVYSDDHQKDAPHMKRLGVPNTKDCWTLLVLTEVCNTDWDVLIACAAVTALWHPWVGLKKEPGEVSEISSDYLLKDNHWGILVLVLSVKLIWVQYNTPALSWCKKNIFWECYLYPEGTVSTFGGTWTGLTGHGMLWLASKYIIVF